MDFDFDTAIRRDAPHLKGGHQVRYRWRIRRCGPVAAGGPLTACDEQYGRAHQGTGRCHEEFANGISVPGLPLLPPVCRSGTTPGAIRGGAGTFPACPASHM